VVVGEETQGLGLVGGGGGDKEGLGPGGVLAVVECAQIEAGVLDGVFAAGLTDTLHNGELAGRLAVFDSFGGAQKHSVWRLSTAEAEGGKGCESSRQGVGNGKVRIYMGNRGADLRK